MRVRWQKKRAADLVVGDYLRTAIGYAPVDSIEPDGQGYLVHVAVRHPRSTRSERDGSVLWFWGPERIRFLPQELAPPLNAARQRALEVGEVAKLPGRGSIRPPGGHSDG
jgi:hypothetical protein